MGGRRTVSPFEERMTKRVAMRIGRRGYGGEGGEGEFARSGKFARSHTDEPCQLYRILNEHESRRITRRDTIITGRSFPRFEKQEGRFIARARF